MELSGELCAQCRLVLLKCTEFDNYTILQSLFATAELRFFKNQLPRADTKEDQITTTISYLVPQRLSDERPAFPLFLARLRDRRDEGNALRDDLEQLRAAVEQELTKTETIDVPFVIVAMTESEACDLMTGDAFCSEDVAPVEQTKFEIFRATFQEQAVDNWLSHYAILRENWMPHTSPDSTIHEIILGIVGNINQVRVGMVMHREVRPKFCSIEFFSQDKDLQEETWQKLAKLGCVLIVDAVSLFHPYLRQALRDSQLEAQDNVATLVLSPLDPSTNETRRLVEEEVRSRMRRAFARFEKNLDKWCEVGVGDLRGLQRWLFTIVPEAADAVQRAQITASRSSFRKMLGKEPNGIDRLIYRS